MAFTLPSSLTASAGQFVQQAAKKSPLQKALEFGNSNLGQSVIGAVGAGLQASGQRASEEANRQQTASQFAVNTSMDEQADQRARAQSVMQDSPIGEAQTFAQRQALLAQILPTLRNQQSTPGDPRVAAAMGTRTGGFRLPEGGLDPAMIAQLYGAQATGDSIARRDMDRISVSPNAPTVNMQALGLQDDPRVAQFQQKTSSDMDAAAQRRRELIQRALDQDALGEKQKKKGGGIGGFFKGLAKVAAPFVSFIPGVGPLASMALSAGLTKASGGSLMDSAMAGAGGYMAKLPTKGPK